MHYITCLIGALTLVGLVGCATNPVTGRKQLSIVPESTVINQSEGAYDAEIGTLRSQGKVVTDPQVVNRVRSVTDQLVRQAITYRADTQNWDWEVHVIDEPKVRNAYCMPGGKMVIFTGLLHGLDLTDDELAQVMAHEVSHALLSHGAEKASVGLVVELLGAAVEATGSTAYDQDLLRLGADLTTQLAWQLPNSRGAEAEADSVGIELAARAGFDPSAAVMLWKKMSADGSTSTFDWFKTHPATPKRMEALAARVDSLQPVYVASLENRRPTSTWGPGASASFAASAAPLATLEDLCNSVAHVDRAACLGQMRVGMHKYDILNTLGSPNEQDSKGTVLRYNALFLQLDSNDRLTRILSRRP